MRPIIGVLGRANSEKLGHNIVCCFEKVRRSIIKNGGIPILILPTQDVEYESLSPKDVYLLTDSEKEMLINEIKTKLKIEVLYNKNLIMQLFLKIA